MSNSTDTEILMIQPRMPDEPRNRLTIRRDYYSDGDIAYAEVEAFRPSHDGEPPRLITVRVPLKTLIAALQMVAEDSEC